MSVCASISGIGTAAPTTLSGTFTKTGAGQRTFDFGGTGGALTGRTFTLVSFDTTDFTITDFAATNLPSGISGDFQIVGNELQFVYGGVIIPEASAGLLALLAVPVLFILRRKI